MQLLVETVTGFNFRLKVLNGWLGKTNEVCYNRNMSKRGRKLMDIHDLKIFLMIAQEGSVSGNTYRNGCKRYAQERLHDKKKVDK